MAPAANLMRQRTICFKMDVECRKSQKEGKAKGGQGRG